jgi:splicing factor 3A subunit 1
MEIENTQENKIIDLDDLEKAKQGKVTGIIIPPPEIRAVVDKTAQFVARNGKSFETKILSSGEGKTAKFNFMKQHDPYHSYYEQKIREFEEGKSATATGATKTPNAPTDTAIAQQQQQQSAVQQVQATVKASFTSPIARFAMIKPSDPPEPFEFSSGIPPGLSSLDIDVIKLTAQYTALNGREFLSGLAQREQRNPQFDFLKPTHMLFSYFTSLVDSYAKILLPSSQLLKQQQQQLHEKHMNKMKILEKCVHRWSWERAEEERIRRESQQADVEKSAYHAVDWQEFVVVETIDFREDELFEQSSFFSGNRFSQSNQQVDHDMDMGDDEDVKHFPPPPPGRFGAPPPPPPPPPPPHGTQQKRQIDDTDMELEDHHHHQSVSYEEDNSDLNIVTDYKPRLKSSQAQGTKLIDPISGRIISAADSTEHMRIQLMDPKWRTEQQRFLEKQQETGFAEGSSIADSLRQFATHRGDIFGSAEADEARLLTEEMNRKKRIEVSIPLLPLLSVSLVLFMTHLLLGDE